ncbi:MAG TPA: pyridoxal-phosphate dependent enzyme, partial [bacterium]|nr:pyridoxal-phosphate dependent enzyme [bacterium]
VCDLLELGITVAPEHVHCVGGYWQPQYSVPNEQMVEAVRLLARTEGVLLDPVYTGKVMAGLVGMARDGTIGKHENVMFLHTGGMPSLFAYQNALLP